MMVKMQHSVQRGFQGYCLSLSGGFSASRLVRWLLGFSACPAASRLRGFSASRLARRLLGFAASRLLGLSGGFSASRLLGFSACAGLLGFSASRLVSYFAASRLLGFSACVGLLGFSASGRISGPLLPVLWKFAIRNPCSSVLQEESLSRWHRENWKVFQDLFKNPPSSGRRHCGTEVGSAKSGLKMGASVGR